MGSDLGPDNSIWPHASYRCSDGGMLIMAKAEQQKAKFRWIDMNRYEVSNKVCWIWSDYR
jgi:crotonobetainyl-CoA:carnitine CoA-transferase CaiB-like acyl-CoA transferase